MPPRKPVDWVAVVIALLALLSSAASGYFYNDKSQASELAALRQAHEDDRANITEIRQRLQAFDAKLDRILEQRR